MFHSIPSIYISVPIFSLNVFSLTCLADAPFLSPQSPYKFCDTNTLYYFISLSNLFWGISFALVLTPGSVKDLVPLYPQHRFAFSMYLMTKMIESSEEPFS